LRFAACTLGEENIHYLAEIVRLCESLGYNDYFHADEKYTRDVYVSLGFCASITKSIGLGITVTDPYTRHPALTAQAIGTLDEACDGRLSVAIGAGSHFETLNIERRKPVTAIREGVELIRGLLAGKTMDLHGQMVNFNRGHLDFVPVRIPPIYIAGRGKGTLRLAGEIGDGVVIGSFATEKGLNYSLNLVKEGAKRASRDYNNIRKLLWTYGCIANDRREAAEAVRRGISHALWSSRELWMSGALEQQVGVTLPESLRQFIKEAPHDWREETMRQLRSLIPDNLAEDLAVAGTVEDVRRKFEMISAAGVDEPIIWAHPARGQKLTDVFSNFARVIADFRDG